MTLRSTTSSEQYHRCICRTAARITNIIAIKTAIIVIDTTCNQLPIIPSLKNWSADSQPANDGGTTTTRIVLSALAETSRFADGLNFSAVGGNEWACKIFNKGARVLESKIPRERSEEPYARSLPSALKNISFHS